MENLDTVITVGSIALASRSLWSRYLVRQFRKPRFRCFRVVAKASRYGSTQKCIAV